VKIDLKIDCQFFNIKFNEWVDLITKRHSKIAVPFFEVSLALTKQKLALCSY